MLPLDEVGGVGDENDELKPGFDVNRIICIFSLVEVHFLCARLWQLWRYGN